MNKDIVLMNFSGVYEDQDFYRRCDTSVMDFSALEGTNCYCDESAMEEIRSRIKELPVDTVHFLDSGNYHYLSLFWLEQLQTEFVLVVFDNHTDMQPPAFEGLLSCGGWIAEAAKCRNLQKILLIGPDEAAFHAVSDDLKQKTRFLSREKLRSLDLNEKESVLKEMLGEIPEGMPLYLSVDKDVLQKEDALTNWSQGDLTLEELSRLILVCGKGHTLLGMDVCGECGAEDAEAACQNDSANAALLNLWKDLRKPYV